MWKRFAKGLVCFFLISVLLASVSYIVDTNNKHFQRELLQLRSQFEHRCKRSLRVGAEIQETSHRRMKRSPELSPASYRGNLSIIILASGVVYYRWGRRDCSGPSNRLIYHGIAAGSYYSNTGGASNHLCLHSNVSYVNGHFIDGGQGASYIYGMEYRDSSWINQLFNLTLTHGASLKYHSVPCAICLATSRVTQLMIPGQGDCPRGWQKEYSGYIMAGAHGDKHSSEAICVDDTPQVVPGTSGDNKGAYLHVSETSCTSLLCEPFVSLREIRCVVCTM